jgi:hypothetical protein
MLTQRDAKKNNFLHLLSKSFIYKVGDTPHPNYEQIISDKLARFCEDRDSDWIGTLKDLLGDQNYEG